MTDKQLTSILSFFIKEELFAFDTDAVRNILELGTITNVPNTKDYFIGVINLHGNIIPVVDLREIMGIKNPENNKDTVIIVLSFDGQAGSFIGMVVDGVKEVFTLNEESALQDTIIGAAKDTLLDISFTGTLRIDKEFIHIINLNELMIEIEN
jgi:purine-binding chemotaxis protein CheW